MVERNLDMGWFDVRDFGASGDGVTQNTGAFQRAIDAASEKCGTVYVPAGVYMTGSLNLKGASLYLDHHAVIKGSPDIRDYPEIGFYHNEMKEVTSLLYCMHQENIHIGGYGTIDFNGDSFYDLNRPAVPAYYREPLTAEQLLECNFTEKESGRVNQPCFFFDVENVTLENITLKNSPCWTVSFSHCRNIKVTGLTIDTSRNIHNNDGLHFSSCDGGIVSGCNISSGDDCIALSAITDWETPCQNFVISDCVLTCCSKAVLIGYMYSHIRNVTVKNCVINDSNRGICITASSGVGLVENVIVDTVIIDTKICAGNWWGNGEPVCILGMQHDNGVNSYVQPQKPSRRTKRCIDNVIMNNIICHGENGIGVVGENGNVEHITLSNIYFTAKESRNLELKGRILDTNPAPYFIDVPEGCFLRIVGAEGVTLFNVNGDEKNGMDKIVSTPYDTSCFIDNAIR